MNRRLRFWIGFFLSLVLTLMMGSLRYPVWSQTASDLLQQGRDLYQTENFHQAVEVLEESVHTLQRQGRPLNQALALNYLALADYRLGRITKAGDRLHSSLDLLSKLDTTDDQQRVQAQVLTTQGQLLLATGDVNTAVEQWQQAHDIYQDLDDLTGMLGTDLNQVQALRSLGRYRLAQKKIEDLRMTLDQQTDPRLKILGWRSLGNTLHIAGQLEDAEVAFENSLALAEAQQSGEAIAAAWLGLGNIERDRSLSQDGALELQNCPVSVTPEPQDRQSAQHHTFCSALAAYEQSVQFATHPASRVRAKLNQFSLQSALGQEIDPSKVQHLTQDLNQLAPGRFAIDAKVNLAHSLMVQADMTQNPAQAATPSTDLGVFQAETLLREAQREAKQLGDRIAESYALGTLGHWYEQQGNVAFAKTKTQAAIQKIQALRANDIAYQWHWQMGRLLQQEAAQKDLIQDAPQGVETPAKQRTRVLQSYDIAFQLLQSLRQDLTALNTDVQFSFRQTIEPFYRQYADTLLQNPTPEDLSQARTVIESLQLAELDNFFQDACSTAQPELLDRIAEAQDPTSAILYPILLGNPASGTQRIEIVAKLPGETELTHVSVPVSGTEVQNTVKDLRSQITSPAGLRDAQRISSQVYQWIVQPLYPDLVEHHTQTLVFVLDTPFQSIPMAALYNEGHYLIEEFAVALTPGLQLLSPQPLQSVQTNLLTGGLTEARLGFTSLPAVGEELDAVEAILPARARLLNETFVEEAIASVLTESTPTVVHLATHGQFSSRAEETFLLAYDGKIDVNELRSLLRSETADLGEQDVIELLVLSACETARGDERAALGLAGMAIRAGARSTLATLWKADDRATADLVSEFYRQFFVEQTGNKAIALREAQLHLLKNTRFKHPRYWAPFVLLGNWL